MGLLKDAVEILVNLGQKGYSAIQAPIIERAITKVHRHILAGGNINDEAIAEDVAKINSGLKSGANPKQKTLYVGLQTKHCQLV